MATVTLQLTDIGIASLFDTGKASYDYMAVGTSTQAFAVDLTTLAAELDRVSISPSVAGTVLNVSGFFNNNDANGTLTECGLFDAASGGNLLAYGTFSSAVTKDSSEALIIDASITGVNDT